MRALAKSSAEGMRPESRYIPCWKLWGKNPLPSRWSQSVSGGCRTEVSIS